MTPPALLILNMETGAMDGWYFDRDLAREQLDGYRRASPNRRLVLVQLVRELDRPQGESALAAQRTPMLSGVAV